MNYLAHLLLSEPTPESRIGNLIADFRRGPLPPEFPEGIQRGIQRHHKIDAYTDAHPVFHLSKELISAPHKRYAGILVDVFYDHMLTRQWTNHATVPLPVFAQEVYQALRENETFLPEAFRQILPDFIEQDWLTSYQSLEGIEAALNRISKRLSRENNLAEAVGDLKQHFPRFQAHFDTFFPDIVRYVELQIMD